MNSARIIIMVVMLNLVLGTIIGIAETTSTLSDTNLQNIETHIQQDFEADFYDEDSIYIKKTATEDTSNEIGDETKWSVNIVNILVKGFNPFSITPDMFETQIEKSIAWGLSFVRTLLSIILIVQAYILIRNKGQT